MDNYTRLAQDIERRIQVCFPQYRIECEVAHFAVYTRLTVHLSLDGRDEWTELVPDSEDSQREIRLQSYHVQLPMPIAENASGSVMQFAREAIVRNFANAWLAERMKRAGLEP